ncbi:MAG: FG-GAP-like repeat-containing protein [Planctomycetota bacterium]
MPPIRRPIRVAAALAPLVLSSLAACGTDREASAADAWRVNDAFVRAMNRGVNGMDQYDYARAAAAFREALSLSPGSQEARLGLALAEFNDRANEGAFAHCTQLVDEVLAAEPENVQALYLRGVFHLDAGEAEAAVPFFARVVERAPRDAVAWYVLARARKQAGLPSREELRRALAEEPNLASAWYDLYLSARIAGDEDEAARALARFEALKDDPFRVQVDFPKYRLMGPLAVVRPLASPPEPPAGAAELSFGPPRALFSSAARLAPPNEDGAPGGLMLAAADVDGDGDLDLATLAHDAPGSARLLLLRNDGAGGFADVTAAAGLAGIDSARAVSFGDADNDGRVDLFVARAGANRFFRGQGDGSFADATSALGAAAAEGVTTASAVFLDADHDADLDLYLCNLPRAGGRPAANQLLQNDASGSFADVTAASGAGGPAGGVAIAPVDLDDDRDTDLVLFPAGAPIAFLRNDLHAGYAAWDPLGEPVAGDGGGLAQDFDGDGSPDLLVFPAGGEPARLYVGRGAGRLERSAAFAAAAARLGSAAGAWRAADLDLDGDLDVARLGAGLQALLAGGRGRFEAREVRLPPEAAPATAADLLDLTGDGVLDLLAVGEDPGVLLLFPGALAPPAHWIALSPTGAIYAASMRSPRSGFGTTVEVRAGLHAQTLVHTGLHGGSGQSVRPLVFGLDGADRTDFVALRWPDGVHQSETDLAAGALHVIAEVQRKPDSCPMLFAWNGERFAFVGDFAGVGGLGYYAGAGPPPPPQVRELVRLGAGELAADGGFFRLRVGEPMQEAAYVDRLELLAVDHPRACEVVPDERLVLTGPPPTQELLCLGPPVFPARAAGPEGAVDVAALRAADRRYAYTPPPDPRFVGYALPHALVLEFGGELAALDPSRPTYLLVDGSLEFPYSQTNFAAGQAGVRWDPPRVDRQRPDGSWETIVADAGAPGGMMRTIAIELSGRIPAGPCTLRLVTNFALFYDRVFLAPDLGREGLAVRAVPLVRAELRRLGFPLEYSPDGGHPRLYDYGTVEATSHLRRLPGRYTRYGPVEELLAEFDDRYAILAAGDEIALDFAAAALPPLAPDRARTFVLVSHAYCKDLDLHSVGPRSVEPLPFRGMSGYPYPEGERYPTGDPERRYRAEYNTRAVR